MSRERDDVAFLRTLLGGDGLHGPGDDAALFEARGSLLVTMDPVIEGRHFDPGTSPARVGRKLVNRNLSDLAAMGAWPTIVTVSFCFGESWPPRRRRSLYRAVHQAVTAVGARWVGGDVAATSGPAVFTACAIGRPCASRPIGRSGLEPGDRLFVTGALGRSRASGWHLDFVPRLVWARRLARAHKPSGMIDVSDGLALDLARMLAASGGVGARLDVAAIPLRRGATLAMALAEGEDHELLFALGRRHLAALGADRRLPSWRARPIGRVEEQPGLRLVWPDGRVDAVAAEGFQHELP